MEINDVSSTFSTIKIVIIATGVILFVIIPLVFCFIRKIFYEEKGKVVYGTIIELIDGLAEAETLNMTKVDKIIVKFKINGKEEKGIVQTALPYSEKTRNKKYPIGSEIKIKVVKLKNPLGDTYNYKGRIIKDLYIKRIILCILGLIFLGIFITSLYLISKY
ncbi:MAG: hypothetical protein HFJ30_06720 [Clostridia bacterium]|jgi:hypothetical protein|nr:hypothetical protein [Clostridia bacterium]